MSILWGLVLHALASWIILGMLFLGYPTIKRLKTYHRDEIGFFMKIPIYCAVFLGLLADVVFNWTWGTVICRELPREFLFTTRLKRHWYHGDAVEAARVEPWVDRVNLIDPGHV